MRITKQNSTKSERRFHEILKELRIPFKFKWIVDGYECDFIVGNYAIEIDGHFQNPKKNIKLLQSGYTPIHFQNRQLKEDRESVKQTIQEKCQEQILEQNEQTQTVT